MFKLKALAAVTAVIMTLSALALPASAHHGGHRGDRACTQTQSWYCGPCQQSHTGVCPAAGSHHAGHHGR